MTDEARTSLERALPAYAIGNRLGDGAFGVVYEGRHTQLDRPVAIKQLPKVYAEDEGVRERFVAEAQMVASLDHPHVVPVYDFVESDGARYLIMERCEGSIADRFRSEGIVTDEACAAVLACLAGLDVAHAKGLLHRDVKPENLMYDAKGVVKLADFGIARDTGTDTRRTATGMIVGTPAYMSPEQCRGDELTPASDVYSVGIMAYELLTGGLPFPDSDSVNGLLAHHLVTEPLPLLQARPELPGSIGEVIDRALAKDLSVRHASAEAFARDLARACVQAFGSGWLRRRRFVLHWPEIIAETEQPSDTSPRTGTIVVRAGDLTHDFDATPGSAAVTAARPAPTPVASVAVSTNDASGASDDEAGGRPWGILGLVALGLIALVAGIIAVAGGGGDDPVAVEIPTPTVVAQAAASTDTETETDTGADTDTGTDLETESADAESNDAENDPAPTVEPATDTSADPAPAPTASPVRFVPTEQPEGIDLTQMLFYGSPRPCPTDRELVACIFTGALDDDTGEFTVAYWVEGFDPTLDPISHHLHFYIDNVVDGDESKAGSATPGGSWRVWDHPWPATSFGGENGRTLFTGPEFEMANGRNICVLVADENHRTIPGSGNCFTPLITSSDIYTNRFLASLTEGQYAGTCSLGVTVGLPSDWRWFQLEGADLADVARQIRPTAAAETEQLLIELVADGGVLFADGPALGDGVPNASFAIWPGDFSMNSSPDEVRAELAQLGITLDGAAVRSLADRRVAVGATPAGVTTYVIPDHGYAIAMSFNDLGDPGLDELGDRIASTVLGC